MRILNAHYNDNHISAIYRGTQLIYTDKDICIEPIAESTQAGGYIYIDDLELQFGYKYEIDFSAPDTYAYSSFNGHECIIGGSYDHSGTNYLGVFIGFPYSGYASDGIGYRINSRLRSGSFVPEAQFPYTPGERQTITITYTGTGTTTRTSGGFFLFAARAHDTGLQHVDPTTAEDWENSFHLFGLSGEGLFGKYYRITIKDSEDTILRNFYPTKQDGHKGVIDTVTGKFYPCANDSLFRVRRA